MKVLWLCNLTISDTDASGTGTWLGTIAHGLMEAGDIQLGVISSGSVKQVTRHNYGQVLQWLVPERSSASRHGLPFPSVVRDIVGACGAFAPDLVHVWGTENYWGLLPRLSRFRGEVKKFSGLRAWDSS